MVFIKFPPRPHHQHGQHQEEDGEAGERDERGRDENRSLWRHQSCQWAGGCCHFITIDVITKILTLDNKENINLCILGREIRGSVEECPEEDPGIVNKIITEMTFINIFDRQWSLSTTCASKTSSTRYHHLDQPRWLSTIPSQTVKLEEMEKKAGNAEGDVSSLRSQNFIPLVFILLFAIKVSSHPSARKQWETRGSSGQGTFLPF